MIDSETEFVISGIFICIGYIAWNIQEKWRVK